MGNEARAQNARGNSEGADDPGSTSQGFTHVNSILNSNNNKNIRCSSKTIKVVHQQDIILMALSITRILGEGPYPQG